MIAENRLVDFLRDVRRVLYKNIRLPAVGQVDLGSLDRVTPVSNVWGFDRGRPADRYYIEGFLADYRTDVHKPARCSGGAVPPGEASRRCRA